MVVVVMMMVRQRRWAERGGCKARGRCGRGGIEIELEVTGWCQDEVEPSLGEVGAGGGTCDAANRWRGSAAADLSGTGQVLGEDRGVVIRCLFELEQRPRRECQGG